MSTKIIWPDETWNPVVGCSKVSEGCLNCYAERGAARLVAIGQEKYKTVLHSKTLSKFILRNKWNGKIFCDESALEIPLHWKKPRRIFVSSMGDLFHKSVPFEFIDRILGTIYVCSQHIYQILTKRPERALDYFNNKNRAGLVQSKGWRQHNVSPEDYIDMPITWPLPNLWLGVTAENQEQWNIRTNILRDIQAAVKFVSIEPMLSQIDCDFVEDMESDMKCDNCGCVGHCDCGIYMCPKCGCGESAEDGENYEGGIDGIILGGESGPGARYCPVENIRSVINQCKSAGVPVFVKQIHLNGKAKAIKDISQFPEDLRIREYPK